MAFTRPTLPELIERARGDLRSALGITAIIRRSFLAAIARTIAGAAHSLHGHLKEISKQAFPDQATGIFLKRWGSIYGVPQKEATYTQLTIDGTGTNGSTMPAGTVYVIDNGETYETDDAVTIALGVFSANVTAVNPGADTNLNNGETMTLQNAVAGFDAIATVSATIIQGSDVETEAAQQARIVQRIQEPPAGGNVNDYIAWVLSIAGVTRAFVFPGWLGQGTVGLSFVQDDLDPIIPIPAKVQEVQDYVVTVAPVTAAVTTFAPVALEVDVTVSISPNTAAVQDAILAELEDLLQRDGKVSGAIDPENISSSTTFDGKILLSKINEAISIATGEDDHVLTLPIVDVEPALGEIAVLGTVTFNPLV